MEADQACLFVQSNCDIEQRQGELELTKYFVMDNIVGGGDSRGYGRMARFQRFQLTTLFSDVDAGTDAAFRRLVLIPFPVRPPFVHLKDHLWILLRVISIVALIGFVSLLVHVS